MIIIIIIIKSCVHLCTHSNLLHAPLVSFSFNFIAQITLDEK
jgi:hypothetical protein